MELQHSLGFFHQPANPCGEFLCAPCNPAHLSAADPEWYIYLPV